MGNTRGRVFATIVYPDSETTPKGWIDILREACIPALISPLHDKDVKIDRETGVITPKQPHFHVVLMYQGPQSERQVEEDIKLFGGVGMMRVRCLRSAAQYLCHLNEKEGEKAKYPIEEVMSCGGANYLDIIRAPETKYEVIGEIIDFCEKEDISSFASLMMQARRNNMEWFKVLCDHTLPILTFLRSREWGKNRTESARSKT